MAYTSRNLRTCLYFFFFFQAEDGIRDKLVTGVQTCALPISRVHRECSRGHYDQPNGKRMQIFHSIRNSDIRSKRWRDHEESNANANSSLAKPRSGDCWCRSEERRVGKECRSRWSTSRA